MYTYPGVWEDRKSMLAYIREGSHVAAMKIVSEIATGKTYGYESDVIPSWEEARQIYDTKATSV